MAHIDYFFATISPFTYLGGTDLEEIAQKHGATIAYKPMDLMTVFSRTGGVPPKDRHISRIELRAQELPRQAKKRKLPLNLQPAFFPVNMAPSSYAVIAASTYGDGDLGALVHGFTRAVWAEQKDISQPEVIADCLKAAGFDWREPGCSMCLAMNADKLAPGERCASTSNRNFEGRQGKGGRTHLMSPGMAAAAALTGKLADVRDV